MCRTVALLMVGMIIIACSSEREYRSEGSIMPLAIGNRWENLRLKYDQDGRLIDSSFFECVVERDTALGEITWFVNSCMPFAHRVNARGLQIRTLHFVTQDAKYPAAAGDTFFHHHDVVWDVVSIDTTIVVPAGSFECVMNRGRDECPMPLVESFYCPDVGLVQRNSYDCNVDGERYLRVSTKLVSYTVR